MFPQLKEIKIKRRILGISQRELARHVGTSQGTIAKIESGKMVPNYVMGGKIFDALYAIERRGETTVDKLIDRKAITVSPEDMIKKAARKMARQGFSNLPVISDGKVVGRITEKILLEAGKENYENACKNFMGAPLPSVAEKTPVSIVRDLLKREPLVVVVGKGGKLKGVVSRIDIL